MTERTFCGLASTHKSRPSGRHHLQHAHTRFSSPVQSPLLVLSCSLAHAKHAPTPLCTLTTQSHPHEASSRAGRRKTETWRGPGLGRVQQGSLRKDAEYARTLPPGLADGYPFSVKSQLTQAPKHLSLYINKPARWSILHAARGSTLPPPPAHTRQAAKEAPAQPPGLPILQKSSLSPCRPSAGKGAVPARQCAPAWAHGCHLQSMPPNTRLDPRTACEIHDSRPPQAVKSRGNRHKWRCVCTHCPHTAALACIAAHRYGIADPCRRRAAPPFPAKCIRARTRSSTTLPSRTECTRDKLT